MRGSDEQHDVANTARSHAIHGLKIEIYGKKGSTALTYVSNLNVVFYSRFFPLLIDSFVFIVPTKTYITMQWKPALMKINV